MWADARERRQPMWLERRSAAPAHDVLHVNVTRNERVGDQHPVALPPDGFGTHDSHVPDSAKHQQLVDRRSKLCCLHVIGVTTESGILPPTIRRIGSRLPQAAERWEMLVLDPFAFQMRVERFTIEMRMASRSRNRADVGQPRNLIRVEQRNELFKASSGVADSPDAVPGHIPLPLQPSCRERAHALR